MLSFLHPKSLSVLSRRYVQALYVSPEKANKNVAVLVPHMKVEEKLSDLSRLESTLKRRNCQTNLSDVCKLRDMVKTLKTRHNAIENRRKELTKSFHELKESTASLIEKDNLKRKIELEGQVWREESRNIRMTLSSVEEQFINEFLNLPNEIDESTTDEAKIIESFSSSEHSFEVTKPHLAAVDQVEFYDKTAFYLKDNAAEFDLNFPFRCIEHFRRHNFIQFSNPDFAKSLIVEGGAVDLNDVYEVKHISHETCSNVLHLVGSASMLSFLGFVTKLHVFPTQLPFRWISHGRLYSAKDNDMPGLFGAHQRTAVQVFMADKIDAECNLFEHTLELTQKVYEALDVQFRLVQVAASELEPAESRKIRIEMFSRELNRFIEVGHLSDYRDYISHRLLFCFEEDGISKFPRIIGGTLFDITKILAILIGNNNGNLQKYRNDRLSAMFSSIQLALR